MFVEQLQEQTRYEDVIRVSKPREEHVPWVDWQCKVSDAHPNKNLDSKWAPMELFNVWAQAVFDSSTHRACRPWFHLDAGLARCTWK